MRLLPTSSIEQALGRAALIFELGDVEERIERILKADHGFTPAEQAQREADQEFAEILNARRSEILATLWPGDDVEPEPTIAEEIEALDGPSIELAVRELLRRHPEITPPSEDLELDAAKAWLLDRINRLPREEREGWRP